MHGILFTKSADRALRKMPQDVARRIREKLDLIAEDPYAQHPNVTRLQNRPGYRLRVGDWRAIYEIEGEELVLLVLRIGSRGEVYR
jgi:mRNA interferase RelE/StbE